MDAAFEVIKNAGSDEAMLYERKPRSLAELEKMMGKKNYTEKVGSHIIKPPGKPTLVDLSDKREPYNSASTDFGGVAAQT